MAGDFEAMVASELVKRVGAILDAWEKFRDQAGMKRDYEAYSAQITQMILGLNRIMDAYGLEERDLVTMTSSLSGREAYWKCLTHLNQIRHASCSKSSRKAQ